MINEEIQTMWLQVVNGVLNIAMGHLDYNTKEAILNNKGPELVKQLSKYWKIEPNLQYWEEMVKQSNEDVVTAQRKAERTGQKYKELIEKYGDTGKKDQ